MLDWAASEGWNPGLDDAAAFHAADPDGFLIAELNGEPAACISVVRYGPSYGFLGFYICRPDCRGQGIGWSIWQAGMRFLGARTIGLDGVVAQQDNYRKSGFVLAHRNARYQGYVDRAVQADPRITAVSADMIAGIEAFDRQCFPAPRGRFLKSWIGGGSSRTALAIIDDGAIAGYGVIRDCREGAKIGPLFANTPDMAEALFHALAAARPGALIIIDCPITNTEAVALAERHGFSQSFETARMYRGAAPAMDMALQYGITSFELG